MINKYNCEEQHIPKMLLFNTNYQHKGVFVINRIHPLPVHVQQQQPNKPPTLI